MPLRTVTTPTHATAAATPVLRRGVVADHRCQRCDHGQAALDQRSRPFPVRLDALQTFRDEEIGDVRQQPNRLEEVAGDDRDEHVQLEVTGEPALRPGRASGVRPDRVRIPADRLAERPALVGREPVAARSYRCV